MGENSPTLQSVSNALHLVLLLRAQADVGVTDAARHLGVGPSTAHRLLTTLQQHGFAEQTHGGRRYRIGPSMTMSSETQAVEHCLEVAYPLMQQLRDDSRETVHISVLAGARAKFVAAVESPLLMRVASRVGLSMPAHVSAAGKVLLAELTDDELAELYPDEELTGATDAGLHTRTALRRELARVRAEGFGRNTGESEEGLAALAVPIPRAAGRVLCSLALTGPLFRFNPDPAAGVSPRELELTTMLRHSAAQIAKQLVY
ncbi:IclR family transcriptional regulator [Amycolatopsis thermoflava]|uniref:IclR family transcriptional regulator n=1 Tax=Amycolatopsis thermoflava TaxID=84480 RepID=UPI003F4A3977